MFLRSARAYPRTTIRLANRCIISTAKLNHPLRYASQMPFLIELQSGRRRAEKAEQSPDNLGEVRIFDSFLGMLKKLGALCTMTETSMDQIKKQQVAFRMIQVTLMEKQKRRAISAVRLQRQVADLEEWQKCLEERMELLDERIDLMREVM